MSLVEARFPRLQDVVIPILREALPEEVHVTSWTPDIDYRTFPIINIRRLGGFRHRGRPYDLDLPVIEMTVYDDKGLVETEDLYIEAMNALFDAQRTQKQVDYGYISHVRETMGMTQFPAQAMDTWRVQGLIQVGIRPPRKDK